MNILWPQLHAKTSMLWLKHDELQYSFFKELVLSLVKPTYRINSTELVNLSM